MADSPILRPPRNTPFSDEIVGPGEVPEHIFPPYRNAGGDCAPVGRVTGRAQNAPWDWVGPKPYSAG